MTILPADNQTSNWSLPTLLEFVTNLTASSEANVQLLGVIHDREIHLKVNPAELANVCAQLLKTLPLYLVTMVALDDRQRSGFYQIRYIFGLDGCAYFLSVEAQLSNESPMYQSISFLMPAANWYEREARDMFGLIPQGHPDPRRLVLHRHWPDGMRALRKDFDGNYFPPFAPDDEEFRNRTQGEGILEIPVGPIHAGIIEPGHFRFSSVGEQIVNLEARLFYTHRGVEKQLEGLPVGRALYLVERNCAACTVSSTLAYCQALEQLAGIEIPERASILRLIYAELERLYNHIGDIGNLCAGVGFHAGIQGGALLKEKLMRLNEKELGSRYLFGLIKPGGVQRGLSNTSGFFVKEKLWDYQNEAYKLLQLVMNKESVMERFEGAGILKNSSARDLGAVGVAARASGVNRDERRDHPYAAYSLPYFQPDHIPVLESGDVKARFIIRAEEITVSFKLILEALDRLTEGPLSIPLGELPAYESAFSLTESPRGSNCHWVMTGPNNTIYRYRIRTASYSNWAVVPRAVLDNIVPDFPLINKSFELCYSCLDR
ncbi:MAG: NADH-quinone oxidoreductase subunit C [Chloroflexi bacterium]|uniref:NADH-quinone oxidoreductase subunit C n=1 Tax=Candidatus Chlorohelix allophototropha TaxID=3003348 RepID=A0A8T7M3M4_9CHLR|nr:NADH-quinone oxidoreductase subunit C [Chloroflexota bacterium]WJW65746.1 NADH-quinone oxidoreductase subunit C [Chloroflexota bacterium L227-S17]